MLVIPDAKDPQALPSGGSRKLWKDVADFLGEPVEEEQRIQDGFDKFRLALTTGDPAPFAAIFIIDATAGCLEAKRMTPLEASLAFVQNTFTQKALIGQDRTWHMDACATLAERVPVWRLGLPRGLEHLESAVDLMEGAVMESPP